MDQFTPLQERETENQRRSAIFISILTASVLFAAGVYVIFQNTPSLLILVVPIFVVSLVAFWLARTGRHVMAGWLLIIGVSLQVILSTLGQSGLGISGALIAFGIIGSISLTVFPSRLIWRASLLSLVVVALTLLIDFAAPLNRPANPNPTGNWIFTGLFLLVYLYLIARRFPAFALRTKVVLGILVIGGIALATLAVYAFTRANTITQNLSKDLAESVKQAIESNLKAVSITNAANINNQFQSVMDDVNQLAEYRASLDDRADVLSLGTNWDAHTHLILFPGGEYSSLPTDPASVFVPSFVPLTEEVASDLNISSYMEADANGIIKKHPSVGAVYYITKDGVVTYFPNIGLANIIPPDFNSTTQNFFVVAAPNNDPKKVPQWTKAYQDPAGIGLILTIAAPVYRNNQFLGVVAADVKLNQISQLVEDVKVGQTGYSFLIDKGGHIISMPPQGYSLLGIAPEQLAAGQETQLSLLGKGPANLQPILSRAAAGQTSLGELTINGVNHYVAYAQIPSTEYSLVTIVPTEELSDAISRSRETVNAEFTSTLTYGGLILGGLFLLATLASLGIGSLIATPVIKLTQTAEQIAAGDFEAQAVADTEDEIGRLAFSFNNMTQQIKDLLGGMEQRVDERSAELAVVNLKNERRAAQFQAIAKVVEAISTTRNLNELLPVIANVISEQFGFYHVGIFLMSENQEYALLSASNSAGGQRMLEKGHQLRVGVVGIVGSVAATKRPLIALDTGNNPTYFNNPDLPETRSEMALPLLTATDIIGVLDVQSREPNAFGLEDVEVLSTLASQVSVAIVNARLYEQTERTLREAETLSRETIRQGWQRYTSSQKVFGIRHTGTKAVILRENATTAEIEDVIRTGTSVITGTASDESDAQMIVPVKLRGETIGVMQIRAAGNRQWTEDDIEVAAAIVERAAITLENARLLFDSQKRADKERVITEITSKIGSFISKDNILQSTAAEIGRILPGTEVIVQLHDRDNGNGHHS